MHKLHFISTPVVHFLCRGSFLQHQLPLAPDVIVTPLGPIGFRSEADYATEFSKQLLARELYPADREHLVRMGDAEQPCLVVSVVHAIDAPSEELVNACWEQFQRSLLVISWSSGENPDLFAVVINRPQGPEFSLRPPFSRRKQRLYLSGEHESALSTPRLLFETAQRDDRFSFALAMYRDALRDTDTEFRVSRFFMCLESLAFRLKRGGVGSRTAVRRLLGIEGAPSASHTLPDGRSVAVDRVEIGGRIRDKLFHGVPFDPTELNDDAQAFYAWAQTHPGYLRDLLSSDCELQLTRWANGTSVGLPSVRTTSADD